MLYDNLGDCEWRDGMFSQYFQLPYAIESDSYKA